MPKLKLTEAEISELINSYNSLLKRLHYQVQKTQDTLKELQKEAGSTVKTKVAKRVGRPAKATLSTATGAVKNLRKSVASKRTANRKRQGRGPSKLSDFDQMLIGVLNEADRILLKNDLIDQASKKARELKLKLNKSQLSTKVSNTLNKLSNKRNEIVKHSHEGRGFAYGLPDWFQGTGGKLKDKYKQSMAPASSVVVEPAAKTAKKRGRPAGSTAKKKAAAKPTAKSAASKQTAAKSTAKRKPGRPPKASTASKTTTSAKTTSKTVAKRKPGRPPKSATTKSSTAAKTKSATKTAAPKKTAAKPAAKRGRGRPKGSTSSKSTKK